MYTQRQYSYLHAHIHMCMHNFARAYTYFCN